MSVAFEAAWMLLKQRGHELNLPKPVRHNVGPNAATMSPQDLTDARVKANSNMMDRINEFKGMDESGWGYGYAGNDAIENAFARLMDRQAENEEMERTLSLAQDHQGEEAYHEGEQSALDRETLARMSQQPEADEMEAMGVPDMSRTLGGTPPPNIGRAGSTNAFEPSSQEYLSYIEQELQEMGLSPEEINYEINNMTPRNIFPKPLAGRVQDQLTEFADGAGRRAAMKPQTDFGDDLKYDNFDDKIEESHPEAHNIASTNLRETPRKTKRGRIDEPRATPRMQGRAARSPSPFIGGQ